MSSKIKQYFANKENRIKCGITGGTIALAVIIFVGMVFMEETETQNNSIETVSQTESDTQTEEETGYSFTRAIFTICGWMHRQSKIII